jgi:hypothetical protein
VAGGISSSCHSNSGQEKALRREKEEIERKHTLKRQYSLMVIMTLLLLIAGYGCTSNGSTPKEALNRYFSSAVKQDYATTYDCYYREYKAKVDKAEYIKHRKEASVLKSYQILALNQTGETAKADVLLTFGPSERLGRKEPVSKRVTEDLVKEGSSWKIKVW